MVHGRCGRRRRGAVPAREEGGEPEDQHEDHAGDQRGQRPTPPPPALQRLRPARQDGGRRLDDRLGGRVRGGARHGPTLERTSDLLRRLRSIGRVLLQERGDQRGHVRRDPRIERVHAWRNRMDVLVRDGHSVVAVERLSAGQHVEQHAPERVQVRAGVDPSAGRLLGCDVRRRSERLTGQRQGGVTALDTRDPEIPDLRDVRCGEEDVRRLHVAVDHALGVRRREPAGDAGSDRGSSGRLDPAEPPKLVAERRPLDQLHHQERPAPVLAGVEHADHVRVVDPREGLRLALEPLACGIVQDQRRRKLLERDAPLQHQIRGGEHLTHAAVAQRTLEAVALRHDDGPRSVR